MIPILVAACIHTPTISCQAGNATAESSKRKDLGFEMRLEFETWRTSILYFEHTLCRSIAFEMQLNVSINKARCSFLLLFDALRNLH